MFSTCFNNFFPFVFAHFGLSIVEVSKSKVAGQETAKASAACQHISNHQLCAISSSTYTCLVEHRDFWTLYSGRMLHITHTRRFIRTAHCHTQRWQKFQKIELKHFLNRILWGEGTWNVSESHVSAVGHKPVEDETVEFPLSQVMKECGVSMEPSHLT